MVKSGWVGREGTEWCPDRRGAENGKQTFGKHEHAHVFVAEKLIGFDDGIATGANGQTSRRVVGHFVVAKNSLSLKQGMVTLRIFIWTIGFGLHQRKV